MKIKSLIYQEKIIIEITAWVLVFSIACAFALVLF